MAEKVFLTRSWRALSSEIDALLNEERFCDTFKGSAARLPRLLKGMQAVAEHSALDEPLPSDVAELENTVYDPTEDG